MSSWHVIETACFPNRWKAVCTGFREDNATTNYFAEFAEAVRECARRNARMMESTDGR